MDFTSVNTMDPSEAIPTLMEFAGIVDAETARRYLEQTGYDINAAAELFLAAASTSQVEPIPEEDLRAPDPQYTQTLLSEHHSRLPGMSSSSRGYPHENVTALAVESSAGTTAFRGLFELPEGLSCKETFAQARELCRLQKKWMLVNIQQVDSFESLRLNRDVWKAEVVMDLIKDFFIFWQRTNRSEEGQVFCDLYRVSSLPHVCAIDPMTGRCLKVWSPRLLSDPVAVQSEFYEFVEQQQAAEQPNASRSQRAKEIAKEAPAFAGAATAVATTAATAVPVATAHTSNGEEKCSSSESPASESPLGADNQPSNYSDVNTQLMELRKLREQRKQQQNSLAQSG